MKKKALLVTRVSGFIPQFETDAVHILQAMGYEVHYAANFDQIVYGKDNIRAVELGLICHPIPDAKGIDEKGTVRPCTLSYAFDRCVGENGSKEDKDSHSDLYRTWLSFL